MQVEVKNISFRYNSSLPWILKDVSLKVKSGERVGLVGPSGYGKSTLAKIIAGYINPDSGRVLCDGNEIGNGGFCPIQLIYQHPEKAVNPRLKMDRILYEGWKVDDKLLKELGIEKSWFKRWPGELSGGELQRFCIARALGPKTKFLVCDEISTMLDVITQAQIWNSLIRICEKNNIGMIAVTHNMSLAKRVCHRIVNLCDINNI
ncbi:ATP-binding cassette domain-containing protein [uncultured Clostridium sp.]|uniref:ABC transporter ATP-binding protein n=1 Tax=uncultured Clostridium sp. TaxID=59620 RepID=UPI0025FC2D8D|nr:ATP-binding cassette domain-containing protein [uncultured Clostridium sp.]